MKNKQKNIIKENNNKIENNKIKSKKITTINKRIIIKVIEVNININLNIVMNTK